MIKLVKLNNKNGISIVETLIALSVLVGVAMTSSYILTNTNVIKNKTETKATIDQIHVIQIQRAKNSDAVRYADPIAKTGPTLNAQQMTCFDGSRTGYDGTNTPGTDDGCNVFATSGIPVAADWTGAIPLSSFTNSDFSMFGEAGAFETKAVWKATCTPDGKRCTSVDVKITTQVKVGSKLAPSAAERKLEPRVSVITFPAQFFVDQKPIQFRCTTGGDIAVSVNNGTNRAICTPPFATVADTSCIDQYPLRNFGDIVTSVPIVVCIPPVALNCSGGSDRGYRQIAFDNKACRNR